MWIVKRGELYLQAETLGEFRYVPEQSRATKFGFRSRAVAHLSAFRCSTPPYTDPARIVRLVPRRKVTPAQCDQLRQAAAVRDAAVAARAEEREACAAFLERTARDLASKVSVEDAQHGPALIMAAMLLRSGAHRVKE